jgi:hypothetical protein
MRPDGLALEWMVALPDVRRNFPGDQRQAADCLDMGRTLAAMVVVSKGPDYFSPHGVNIPRDGGEAEKWEPAL